ncbi:MAG: PPC domain-containing protein [Acidobacteria bacterium]|nr:PPC domain-containing protein [Acidobacteriota bacterium]
MKKFLGFILLAFLGFATPLFAQRTAIFPRFVSGDGWTSQFFFTNQGISTVQDIVVKFYAYNSSGTRVQVTTNLGTAYEFTFTLTAGSTQAIRITSGSGSVQGYVLIDYPSFDDPIRASEVFNYEAGGVVTTEVGVPQQELGDHFSFPVEIDPTKHVYPAVALSNPLSEAQTLVVNLHNSNGSIQSTAIVPMQAGEHRAGYLDQDWLFPGLNNSTFIGSASVSSPFGIGVLTLRQDKNAFGGIGTDGGAILAPFSVTSPFGFDSEPNDYTEEAQLITLPVKISGSIEYAGDWDFYRFYGNAGQILTVVSDSTGLDSALDSLLIIYDADQNQIAYNDQNGLAPGLYPQNDSFVQVQLPNTGIYYIAIQDYFGDAGDTTGYEYNLHIKVR